MKITDKRKKEKEYGELKRGDCFERGGEIYIKTDIIEDDVLNDFYAVNLSTGIKCALEQDAIVFPVNAELLIG